MNLLPINNYSQFKILYQSVNNNIQKLDTNCLLPGKVLRDSIRDNSLYYREFPEGLILYVDEGNLYKIYYFLDNSKPFPDLRCGKNVMIEELDSNNRRQDYLNYFSRKIYQAGFSLESKNIQFEINLTEQKQWILSEYEKAAKRLNTNGLLATVKPDNAQVKQILEIWKLYLKQTDVPISHTKFLTDIEQSVVCILNKNASVCGTLWWIFRGNYCEIRHIVTHPDYYRMGISNYTMLFSFMKALEGNSKSVISYTDIQNEKSILMHRRAGMKENGKISMQFLLEA